MTVKSRNISDNTELCRIFRNYFSNIVSDLQKPNLINNGTIDSNINSYPVSIATKIFDQHPSIINVRKRKFSSVLSFKTTGKLKVEKVIKILNIVKACEKKGISTKVIKKNASFIAKILATVLIKVYFQMT